MTGPDLTCSVAIVWLIMSGQALLTHWTVVTSRIHWSTLSPCYAAYPTQLRNTLLLLRTQFLWRKFRHLVTISGLVVGLLCFCAVVGVIVSFCTWCPLKRSEILKCCADAFHYVVYVAFCYQLSMLTLCTHHWWYLKRMNNKSIFWSLLFWTLTNECKIGLSDLNYQHKLWSEGRSVWFFLAT